MDFLDKYFRIDGKFKDAPKAAEAVDSSTSPTSPFVPTLSHPPPLQMQIKGSLLKVTRLQNIGKSTL